jgi:two-component system cell cycle sensor histidine kinase/response regulator CckA
MRPGGGCAGRLVEGALVAVGTAGLFLAVGFRARVRRVERSVAVGDSSRSMLASIVESADEAIIGCDLDGTITSWNHGAERLYGHSVESAVGQSIELLRGPATTSAGGQPAFADLIAAGQGLLQPETTGIHRDGHVLRVAVRLSPIRNSAGQLTGAAAFVRDIAATTHDADERVALERRLHQAQRAESLGQLAGGIAHDFNNLLAVIATSVDFIIEESDDPEAVRADAAQIREAADRATHLTRQLMTFARGERLPAQTVDLAVVINGLRPLLERSAGPLVELRVATGGVVPTVHADPGRLEQILLNLVVNARDAMADGGVLDIATDVVELLGNEAGLSPASRPGPYVLLTVRDEGSGMSPDVVHRIFEPFFSTKPRSSGTGLGLATVWGIVTEARGSIAVDTAPGRGTTFRLYLPRVAPPAPRAEPLRSGGGVAGDAQLPGTTGIRVLVVEDEQPIRDLVARILRGAGHEVLVASSGPEALERAAGQELDLLVTDMVMPVMSGSRLAELLQQSHSGLGALFMSGYSGGFLAGRVDRTAARTRGAGVRTDDAVGGAGPGVLEKPFTTRQLLDQVGLVLAAATSPAAAVSSGAGEAAELPAR